ncbi:MAG: DNA polymerase IV [Candidatus Cloacimonetes bacterium HGW-Cloacimonetes-3]|nr:MAG: DNA polymerase IV [Candidatus Cloacimonetes bacterium HGW-Cloacimonetes-3]
MKKIIHIDMDAYFAAIEIREDPSLKGKCVVVGGAPNSRGVVSTCSYEARKYGIHSGMSSYQAWNLCPQAVFVHSSFKLYKEVSQQIREIFYKWTELVEPMSLDEAYLDVTQNKMGENNPEKIAMLIKQDIFDTTRLTCSAGVSYNKFLAKIGSELHKPDGLSIITPDNAQDILFSLPIGKFHGIGKVTAARMQKLGIHTGKELYQWELKDLMKIFGKTGMFYYHVVRGIDDREIITEFEPKSISCESTFDTDLDSMDELFDVLRKLSERLSSRMAQKCISGQNVVLKLKYDNFEYITRSCPMKGSGNDPATLYKYGEQLLVANWESSRKVRLLGLGVGKLDKSGDCEQLSIPL